MIITYEKGKHQSQIVKLLVVSEIYPFLVNQSGGG